MTSSTHPELPPAATAVLDRQRKRGLFFLGTAVGCAGFVLAMQLGLNENFLVEEIEASWFQRGLLESVREACGISALLLLALLAGFAEPLVAAVMLIVVGVGIGGYAFAPSYAWVVGISLVWSQGLHVWMPLPDSMALALAEPGRKGYRLGQTRSAGAIGFGTGLLSAYVLTQLGVPIRPLFLLAAVAGVLAAAACLGIPRQIKTSGPRLVFRRRYGLYYILSFLEGWRKQIFLCFAAFLLVMEHQTDLKTMLLLWGGVQAIGYFAAPPVGRLIDRVGERKILVFYFACLTVFFLGYATIANKYVLYGLFVVDSAFFVFAMALTTYVGRLAPPNERTPTLSMGVAMNHAAAVIMPLIGGAVWKLFGYQWIFVIGALVALVSIGPAICLPKQQRQTGPGESSDTDTEERLNIPPD